MVRFAVCDDEKVHIDIICGLLDKVMKKPGLEYAVFKYPTATGLVNAKENYDILFLDIRLDAGTDGIKIGRQISESRSPAPIIILVTSQNDRVFDGYHTKAHRYLMKPIQYEVFMEAVMSAIAELNNSTKRLEVRQNQTTYFIPIQTVEFIEGFKKRKIIHAGGSEYYTYENWEDILPKLPAKQFFQIHQSFCVNLERVFSTNQTEITLNSGKKILMARSKKKEFAAALNSYLEG